MRRGKKRGGKRDTGRQRPSRGVLKGGIGAEVEQQVGRGGVPHGACDKKRGASSPAHAVTRLPERARVVCSRTRTLPKQKIARV